MKTYLKILMWMQLIVVIILFVHDEWKLLGPATAALVGLYMFHDYEVRLKAEKKKYKEFKDAIHNFILQGHEEGRKEILLARKNNQQGLHVDLDKLYEVGGSGKTLTSLNELINKF